MIGRELGDDEESPKVLSVNVMFSNFASCNSFADLLSDITGFKYVGLKDCRYKSLYG